MGRKIEDAGFVGSKIRDEWNAPREPDDMRVTLLRHKVAPAVELLDRVGGEAFGRPLRAMEAPLLLPLGYVRNTR